MSAIKLKVCPLSAVELVRTWVGQSSFAFVLRLRIGEADAFEMQRMAWEMREHVRVRRQMG